MAAADWQDGRTYPTLDTLHTQNRFSDFVVLVTGGCSGIGRATVERFANDGAHVYALDIRVQGEQELRQKYRSRVSCVYLDVTDSDMCKSVVADIASKHSGKINTLVNCAAYFGSKGLKATKEDWDKSLSVNVKGYANTVQAVAQYMDSAVAPSIVNVSSISAHRCQPDRWTYSATKGAIDQLTRCMALDLGKMASHIRVNSVSPAWIWTPEGAKAFENNRTENEAAAGQFHILNRVGEVEEVAAAIAFLASRDAAFITGADLHVCGGYLAMGPERSGESSHFAAHRSTF